jgi:hypothetical protein
MHSFLFRKGNSQTSYAHGTQDYASNAKHSRRATQVHSDDNDSDHSLFHLHSDDHRKQTSRQASTVNERNSDDLPLDRVQSADNRITPENALSKW